METSEDVEAVSERRPVGVTILAWLHIIFAVLGLLLLPWVILDPPQELPNDFLSMPQLSPLETITWSVLSAVFSSLIGVGFLFRKNWSRWLCFADTPIFVIAQAILYGFSVVYLFSLPFYIVYLVILLQKDAIDYFTIPQDETIPAYTIQDFFKEFISVGRKVLSTILFMFSLPALPILTAILPFSFVISMNPLIVALMFIVALGITVLGTIAWSSEKWRGVLGWANIGSCAFVILILAPFMIATVILYPGPEEYYASDIDSGPGYVLGAILLALPYVAQLVIGFVLIRWQRKIDKKKTGLADLPDNKGVI